MHVAKDRGPVVQPRKIPNALTLEATPEAWRAHVGDQAGKGNHLSLLKAKTRMEFPA
jgi:hypothetical protein